jgi:hypothetical protein
LASSSATDQAQHEAVAQDVAEHANERGRRHVQEIAAEARKTAQHTRGEMAS